jgi:hypothetical protein
MVVSRAPTFVAMMASVILSTFAASAGDSWEACVWVSSQAWVRGSLADSKNNHDSEEYMHMSSVRGGEGGERSKKVGGFDVAQEEKKGT